MTALLFAVKSGNESTVEVLVKSGVNVNARNVLGETPLICAAQMGSVQ